MTSLNRITEIRLHEIDHNLISIYELHSLMIIEQCSIQANEQTIKIQGESKLSEGMVCLYIWSYEIYVTDGLQRINDLWSLSMNIVHYY